MLALGKQRQVDFCEFEDSLVYRASSRTARETQRKVLFLIILELRLWKTNKEIKSVVRFWSEGSEAPVNDVLTPARDNVLLKRSPGILGSHALALEGIFHRSPETKEWGSEDRVSTLLQMVLMMNLVSQDIAALIPYFVQIWVKKFGCQLRVRHWEIGAEKSWTPLN